MLGLIGRLMFIEYTSGDAYTKKVLSLQSYDSKTIPFQRGNIVDSNGTVLATSVAVYNVVLDCSVMTSKKRVYNSDDRCTDTVLSGFKTGQHLRIMQITARITNILYC